MTNPAKSSQLILLCMGQLIREKPYTNGEVQLLACPCGYVFIGQEKRHVHFEREHLPEDFGLSPIRTRAVQSRLRDYSES